MESKDHKKQIGSIQELGIEKAEALNKLQNGGEIRGRNNIKKIVEFKDAEKLDKVERAEADTLYELDESYEVPEIAKAMREIACCAKKINVNLTEYQCQQFFDYYKLLILWNRKMNLTAITQFKAVLIKHFQDSLAIAQYYDFQERKKIIDVGTGAGFPGIPIKIAFPNTEIVLLDSLNKRITFLENVVEKLNLTSIKCIHGRSEDFGRKDEYREKFDLCVSRAVANLAVLSEYCLPFIKVKGCFVSYKAGNLTEELRSAEQAIKILGGDIRKVEEYQLAGTDMERTLVKIEKIKSTSKKYPRTAGKPVKEPLR